MDSNYYPNQYRVTTSTPTTNESSGGGSNWVWAILFLISLLVIAGLIVWLVLALRRESKGKLIEFSGANIEVASNTSITATWPKTSDSSDVVTLWATTQNPLFKSDGTLTNGGPNTKQIKAPSDATSVTLTGLSPRIKYFATLIVTSPKTSNYQVYTQVVYMDAQTPVTMINGNVNYFAIEDMLQVGKLQLKDNNTVLFEQTPIEGSSLWNMNTDGQIQSKSNTDMCLYSNNGTLASESCATLNAAQPNNSKWTYNPGQGKFANRWCLARTVDSNNPLCMVLGPISSGSASVSVSSTSTAADGWVNAFETTV